MVLAAWCIRIFEHSTPQEEQYTGLRGSLAMLSMALADKSILPLAPPAPSVEDEASPSAAAALRMAGVRSLPLES